MNWFNLKKNKCPQCNKDFMKGLVVRERIGIDKIKLMLHPCGFSITEQKYKEIVSNMVTKENNNNQNNNYDTSDNN